MSDVIYEDKERRLVIERSSTYTPECIALLERTVWGTRGLLYTMHDVAHTLDGIREPHFLALKENGELIAVAVRSRKTLGVGMHTYNAFHLALMAVDTPKIGRGYGKLLVEQSRRYFLGEVGTRGLLYGYIEAGNARSLALNAKLGYQPIGRFHTTLFSRLRPRDDPRVGRLNATERDTLVQRLNDLYADHALLDFEQSVEAEVYYVLRHAGEIIAGVQAERLHWSIRHLPGLRGMFLVRGLPSLPILRHLFATKDYHFLRLGNIYAQGGHEACPSGKPA